MLYHRTKLIRHSSFPSSSPSCVCFHAYMTHAHPKVVSERKKRARYTEEKSSTNRLSAKCLVTAKCARAPLGRNQIFNADCMHHCLLNVSPFPSASSRALYEGTKNKEFRDTKPNLFSSLLERVGSVILVQHGSPSRAFPPPARATVKSEADNRFDIHHRLQTRARETREVCLIRSDRREKKKIDVFPQKKPF